jgi:hypothetical protein
MNGQKPRILEVLQDAQMVPVDAGVERRLESAEYEMIRHLDEIVRRAQDLLGQIRMDGRPDLAAFRIADSAGASGPIGSTYEKLVHAATEMNVLLTCATMKVEAK